MPRLSIIIVTFNSAQEIGACLDALASQPPRVDHEVIVVDNASTDGTADLVRRRSDGVRVVDAGANVGFAAANNIGIRQTSGELILLLNPDATVRAGAIDRLVQTLDQRADAAVVGPRLLDARGAAELSFGPMISPLNELRQKRRRRNRALVERMTRIPADVDWVSGACLMVRRSDATAVGLLDERFFMYTEDVDFCAAIRARGRRVLFEPDAEVVHVRGASRRSASAATDAAYRRSQLAFYDKHHPRWTLLLRAYLWVRGKAW